MRKNYFPLVFFSLFCFAFSARISAQINVTSNPSLTQLMSSLVGSGAVVTNEQIVCPNGAFGTFTNGNTTNLGITAGVLLTTGSASAVNGPASSFASVDNLGAGNSLLTGMAGATTYEECRLEFDIMPVCSSLQMSYVFGSEEYPEWVGAGYNDAFGFFVTGPNPGGGNYTNQNIALVPGTSTFVGIDNVNSSSNSAYYIDNTVGTTIAYDGLTSVLTASVSVTPCQTYHMILVIADGGDGVYDSGVFLTFQGLTCPAPTVSVAGGTTVCPGGSATLTASGMTSYTWQPGGMTGSSITVNPTTTTSYTVTATQGLCNVDSAVVTVVVSAPAVTASNSGPYCVGSSVSLSSTGGGTYSWSGPNGFTSTSQNPSIASATLADDGVYTVTVTAGSCTSTATTSVTVGPPPTPTSSNTGPYCEGTTIDLSSSGGSTYVWSGPGGYSSSSQNPSIGSSTTSMSGTYTVTVSVGSCSATSTTSVTVNPLPVPTASNNGPYCIGSQIDLSAGGGGNYSWSGPNGFTSTSQNPSIPNITQADSGIYTVTVTDGVTGCVSVTTTTVNINATLVPTINSNGPVCNGDTLAVSCVNGTTWSWSGPNGFTSTAQNISFEPLTPSDTGTYTVNVTDAMGCSGTTTINVNINPLPVVSASAAAICSGDTGSISATGAVNYTWSAGTTPATGATVSANPSSTTTFTVTGIDANGCEDTATVIMNVNALPLISATSGSICPGMSDTLIASGAQTYSWSAGTSSISANQDTVVVSPASTTSYTVTGTDGNGCIDTVITNVTVSATGVTLTMSANPNICLGDSTTLTVSGANVYTWNPGAVNGPSVTVSPATTTTYTVNATDLSGCTGTGTVTVSVAPTMTPTTSGTNLTCNNSCNGQASIAVSPSSGQFANYTYQWNNGTNTATATNLCAGTYTVVVTDGAGCTITDTITLTQPTVLVSNSTSSDVLCNGGSTGTASVTINGGTPNYSVLWSNGASGVSQTNFAAGTYTAIISDANNCLDTVVVTIAQPTAMTMTLTPTTITCVNPAGAITSNVNGGTPGYTYSWSPSGSGQNPSGLPANTYTLTVTDANNCVATQTVVVASNVNPPGANAGQDAILNCGGAPLILSGSSPATGVNYSWSGPNGYTSTSQNPSVSTAGNYTVTVTNPNNGCTSTDTVTITQATIDASFLNNPGSGIAPLTVTFLNTSTNATSYVWDFGNGTGSFNTNDTTMYVLSGTYTVTLYAQNNFGCIDSTTAIIIVNDPTSILIPNVFTPNGDGTNDVFFITSTGLKELEVIIYDRWGLLMSQFTDLNGGWNGKTPSGADAADGTYFYMVKAIGIDGKEISQQGHLLLAR